MGLVRKTLKKIYAPSKNNASTPYKLLYISTESPRRPVLASPKHWALFESPKGNEKSPWDV